MHGGWIGVEVFFVVSGFLITSLLLDERGRTRRASTWRRSGCGAPAGCSPRSFVMLAVVAVWALVVGSDGQLRPAAPGHPWALFYAGNWGQIVGDVPYYAGDPPLLRHLWSLAIEEQFYLAVAAGVRRPHPRRGCARVGDRRRCVGGGRAGRRSVAMFWLHAGRRRDRSAASIGSTSCTCRRSPGPAGCCSVPRRRSCGGRGGLAAPAPSAPPAARPGRRRRPSALLGCIAGGRRADRRLRLPVAAAAGLAARARRRAWSSSIRRPSGCGGCSAGGRSSPSAGAATACTCGTGRSSCSPGRRTARPAGSSPPWRSRSCAPSCATATSRRRCGSGALGPVVAPRRAAPGRRRSPRRGAAVAVLVGCYVAVDPFDRAEGGEDAAFVAPGRASAHAGVRPHRPPPALPRRVAIVGDSQAHSLAVNLPDGIEQHVRGHRRLARRLQRVRPGERAQLAGRLRQLVRDVRRVAGRVGRRGPRRRRRRRPRRARRVGRLRPRDGRRRRAHVRHRRRGTRYVRANLQSGVDALVGAGAQVALLEVPCMRPQDVDGRRRPAAARARRRRPRRPRQRAAAGGRRRATRPR